MTLKWCLGINPKCSSSKRNSLLHYKCLKILCEKQFVYKHNSHILATKNAQAVSSPGIQQLHCNFALLHFGSCQQYTECNGDNVLYVSVHMKLHNIYKASSDVYDFPIHMVYFLLFFVTLFAKS